MITTPSIRAEYDNILKRKVFPSEKERVAFIETLNDNIFDSPGVDADSKEGKAIALLIRAHELNGEEGMELARKALLIDPGCIDAWNFLGEEEADDRKSMIYYRNGIEIGRKLFCGEYLKSNRGLFCSIPETRAYMHCLAGYGSDLCALRLFEQAIRVYETILSLDVKDHLSVRHELMTALIRTGDIKRFRKYEARLIDDPLIYMIFNRVLFAFMTSGDSENANTLLKEGIARNKYVVPVLITLTKTKALPELDGGEFSWAYMYSLMTKDTWLEVKGAINWLRSKHIVNEQSISTIDTETK